MKPVVTEVINFCHELDLLEAHLDEHQHFMDRIVVVESGATYSGMPKPLYFEQNKERCSWWIYCPWQDLVTASPIVGRRLNNDPFFLARSARGLADHQRRQ